MRRVTAFVVVGLVLIVAAYAVRGCRTMHDAHTTPDATPMSWDSRRLRSVQEEWDALRDSFGKNTWTQDNWDDRHEKLEAVLKKRLSEEDLRQLAASSDKLPIRAEDCSPFANSLFEYMVITFVNSGDRESLVTLLSTRFRQRIGFYCDIEFGLVAIGEKRRTLKYPGLILGDAYARCKVPEVRRDIAAVVRRGFDTMHIRGLETGTQSDDEYVKEAMKWYNAHKEDLVPNVDYIHNARLDWPIYPLFTWKAAPTKQD